MPLNSVFHHPSGVDGAYEAIHEWAGEQGLTLYPAQEEAILELVGGANVILATPTGSGKSLVALAAHAIAAAQGVRSYYTAPIKALVSEKFFALCDTFGAEQVGMITGDASVNAGAPIICATAEIVANLALREGAGAEVGLLIMDEFHYYADPDRGWAWQVPLIELPHTQFLLMSATLGDVEFFRTDLTRRTGRPTVLVANAERPVPLVYRYALTPISETIDELVHTHQAPVYVVHFTQAAAVGRAQALTSTELLTKQQKQDIAGALDGFVFAAGFGVTLSRLVRRGIGVHHAGMLPKYRRLVEVLAQQGLLRVICGTDTLGVGINVPIRTVLLTGLVKFDGVRMRQLKAREFHQIAGRAGRAGFDTVGCVVVQAPDHEVENARLVAKAGDDPKKLRRIQRKKPPEGQVSWTEPTFKRLIAAEPEALVSRFRVSNAMLLNVIARPGNCFQAMRHLLQDNHETPRNQRKHILRAFELYRALRAAGIVVRREEPDEDGRMAALTVDLQRDFALDQPLSAFAIATFELLDTDSPDYVLDVISVIESTLEDPRQLVLAQQHAARGAAIERMKADGIEYEERVALIEDITWPRPLAELLGAAFEIYRGSHPWLAEFAPAPKSVVREMIENAMTFTELISRYGLGRSEGVVLRYLADAYRALRRTVPASARTPELDDYISWLGATVRATDSSLVDEWEQLTAPAGQEGGATAPPPPGSRFDERAFRVSVRNAMFARVRLIAEHKWDQLAALGDHDAQSWADWFAPYFDEYGTILVTGDARGPRMFDVVPENDYWAVRQVIADPDGDHGWALEAKVEVPDINDDSPPVFTEMTVVAG